MKANTFRFLLSLMIFLSHTIVFSQPNIFKKRKDDEPDWQTSYALKGKQFIGIAPIVEATTGIIRSFTVGELLRDHPLQMNGQILPVALVNHYFEAPYAVSGSLEAGRFRLRIYINGKRVSEEYCGDNMYEVLTVIARSIGAETDLPEKTTIINISEGSGDKWPEKSINQLLPGQLYCRVPEDTIINIFKQLQSIESYKVEDVYEAARFVKGRFGPIDETDINFFKWREIPYTMKDVARKLIFPRTASMGPALSYISLGNQLYHRGDGRAAMHCYIGAIGTSKDLLASPFEASALRYVALRELAKIYESPPEGRKKTADLFQLLSSAHLAFLNDTASKKERAQYYQSIVDIGVKFQEAESDAQSQRATRTFSMINSGLSAASSLTAAATGNQQASALYLDESKRGLTKQFEQDRVSKEQLLNKYKDYDRKVNAASFRMDDGMNFDQGKPISPGEIIYLLIKSPETTFRLLNAFAVDKPKLKSLIGSTNQNKREEHLELIFQYFNDYEMKVFNYECRGLVIPAKVMAEF
jgi:hypothetical protein